MTWTEHIHADPAILGGKPVIKGTRLAVDFVLALLAEGWTREQLRADYPQLTDEGLRAVFAYAADALHEQTLLTVRPGTAQMRLLADESIPMQSVRALRSAGHDVFAASEALLLELLARPENTWRSHLSVVDRAHVRQRPL